MKDLIITLIIIFSAVACSEQVPQEKILFDFEMDAELDRIHWKCFTMFSLSDKFATHGMKSLKMELYPSNWPGWTPKLDDNNWRRFETLEFDVHNPESRAVTLTVRIDDREDFPDYGDRYNQSFVMKPGANSIQIPLDNLVTSGSKRSLDLEKIYRFLIFMGHPEQKHVLYLDYLRLGKAGMLGS